MRKILKHILNPDIQLRDRLFQLLSTIALAEFVVVTIYGFISGGSTANNIIMVAGTIVFAGVVAFTIRSGKIRLGSALSGLLYFLIYPLTFFSSGGMYGGAPVVFAFALVYVFLITQKWERVVLLALCVIGSGVCYLLAYLHPELLTRHTRSEEHIESFLSILLVVLLLCALFAFVTEVYKTENQIVQRQKKEIEELNLAQKRFFSSMSHEIRTPVNVILGMNEANLRCDIPDEVRENSRSIDAAGRSLLHTINEILDMSQLEAGSMKIVPCNYQTASMLSDVVNMTRIQAEEKNLAFIIKVAPELPSELFGDVVRIKQILLNVITNAVKYTKTGSVSFTVSGKAEEADGYCLIFDVTDTGIGIREENIPYLFDAFQRVDEQSTHTIEGTGLGLSIVKQLLDRMGGKVFVSSEYGKGSTFLLEIPQKIIDGHPVGKLDWKAVSRSEVSDDDVMPDFSSVKILAVDDIAMNLKVVEKLLQETNAMIDTAFSGADALAKTMNTAYDIILMDHQMPEMDGVECLHRIRIQEKGKCRNSKIICLTANAGAEMEQLYKKEGFDGYLVKPVKGDVLKKTIKEVLNSNNSLISSSLQSENSGLKLKTHSIHKSMV